jgi:hemolysin-activating ACP:hemolysin acyltransferase|tara:strand:+ start:618 stop:1019 length:402 start_codon:yes stop_codon:yes gene_type:complete
MQDIISLYRNYNKFNVCEDKELNEYLNPSIKLNQYKKHYYNNELIGFTNWALLSNQAHINFQSNGILNERDWNSGNNLWHIETICKSNLKSIMNWTKSFLTKKFGIGKEINWLRIKNNKIVRIVTRTTKESWL